VTVDVLAISPHPDDVEIGVGGLLHKLARRAHAVAILDLTGGELASRGTVDERRAEAAEAARILRAATRESAGLADGHIANTPAQRLEVIPFIRALRPRVILAPRPDRHPDHGAAGDLVRDANFFAGVAAVDTGQEPYRAPIVYFYTVHGDPEPPSLVVDISEDFEEKLAALRAYRSQFHNPGYEGAPTYVSSPAFWDAIQTRAAYWGSCIRARYGEPLYSEGPVGVAFPPGLGDSA